MGEERTARYKGYASLLAECKFKEAAFEDALTDLPCVGEGWQGLTSDYYDNSVEFKACDDAMRLDEQAQKIVFEAGFSIAFVNHENGWETHYSWDQRIPFVAARGWRRKRTESGFQINYLPPGWGRQGLEWVESGYMEIVGGD